MNNNNNNDNKNNIYIFFNISPSRFKTAPLNTNEGGRVYKLLNFFLSFTF
jgi:hypothetical protein